MKMIDSLLAELEQEAQTTRRVLERIPEAHLTWKPHPKSMSLGQLALHVATVPGSVAELAAMDLVPEPSKFIQPQPTTTAELVPSLTESRRPAASAASTMRGWARRGGSGPQPRHSDDAARRVRRAIMLNHWYHRGQLLVYLGSSINQCRRCTGRQRTRTRSRRKGVARLGFEPRAPVGDMLCSKASA